MDAPLFSCPLLSSKLDYPAIKISKRHSLKLKKIRCPMFIQENLIWKKEVDTYWMWAYILKLLVTKLVLTLVLSS